jgi:Domain of unknown function (DUF397)
VDDLVWVKSSLSFANSNCVQVACASGECVEVEAAAGGVLVRDSKDPAGPVLAFTPGEWAEFLAGVKAGEFDHLTGPEGTG